MRRPLVAAAVLALCAPAAQAAPYTYTDKADDTLTGSPGHDVRSVGYAVRGRGADRELVVTLTLGSTPSGDTAVSYRVTAAVAGGACSRLSLQYLPGSVYGRQVAPSWMDGDCAVATPTIGGVTGYRQVVRPEVRRNAIVWRVRLADTRLVVGAELYDHLTLVEPSDPAVGIVRAGELMYHLDGRALDVADSFQGWRLG